MTIDLCSSLPPYAQQRDEIVQFVYRAAGAPGMVAKARALLDAAPRELAESFEQAVRTAGLAS